jgi:hypothetical protein
MAFVVSGGSVVYGQHAGDIWVGRSAAGQLKIDTVCSPSCGFDPAKSIVVLPPDDFGGYSLDSPGFDRIVAAQPDEDLYLLEPGVQVRLQIVSADAPATLAGLMLSPAMFIYDPVTFTFFPYESGTTLYREVAIGNYQLHKHVVWFLDSSDPAFDPSQCVWEMTVRLIDAGTTGYAASEPFTLRFALHLPVPGDFDCDRDVDDVDLASFEACHSGPAMAVTAACEKADLDGDGDADSTDFGILQRCWTGAGAIGDPECDR